jgi:hypothetical protein
MATTEYYDFTMIYLQKDPTATLKVRWNIGAGIELLDGTNIFIPYIITASVNPTLTTCPGASSGGSSSSTSMAAEAETPQYVESISIVILSFTIGSILTGFAQNFLFNVSMLSSYAYIYHLQLFFLLPMIKITMHSDVLDLFEWLNFYLFNFSFLPDSLRFTDTSNTDPNAVPQTNSYLKQIELKSGSSFYNVGELLFVICIYLAVHLAVVFIYLISTKVSAESGFSKAVRYVFNAFHFAVPIRFFLLTYLFLMLSSISELAINNENGDKGGSYAFAFVLFLIGIATLIVMAVQLVLSRNKERFEKMSRFNEVFRGLKDSTLARTYPIIFYGRMLLFIILV